MKNILILLLVIPIVLSGQVTDDFSDGDFTTNPSWTGTDTTFIINNSLQLQLNATIAGRAWLSTPIENHEEIEWRFWIKESFSPSGNNFCDVFLSGNSAQLNEVTEGYFLRFGEAGSNDAIELFRKNGTENTSICRGSDALIASSFELDIKVVRDSDGGWQILYDNNNSGIYQLDASGTDNSFAPNGYFGFLATFTASNSTKFFFDDIYIGTYQVDQTPPNLLTTSVKSQNEIELLFDEALDNSVLENQNFSVNNNLGNPMLVTFGDNSSIVLLTFENNFESGINYTLSIENIKDLVGNISSTIQTEFSFYEAGENDIVINEIMSDPTPIVGLPEWEYIELYNGSGFDIELRDWQLTIGTTSKTFENYNFTADSYLLLCHENAVEELAVFGNIYSFSSFQIANSGATISLINNYGNIVSSVTFDISWFDDPDKDDGGWSLEQIDPSNLCSGQFNWTASVAESGGTPGSINSVFAQNTSAPLVSSLDVVADTVLHLFFNQQMDIETLSNIDAYQIVETSQKPITANVNPDVPNFVELIFANSFETGAINILSIAESITNCMGIAVEPNTTASFIIPGEVVENDIVINEIMADESPVAGLPEWEYVELYNVSDSDIELKDWLFVIGTTAKTFDSYILPAGSYLILCNNNAVEEFSQYGDVVGFSSFQITNSGTTLSLVNSTGFAVSSVTFSDTWYNDSEKAEGGWSLEQIDPTNPCAGKNNWTASINPLGGTPGSLNSVDAPNIIAPKIDLINMISENILHLYFDQKMNSSTLENTDAYQIKETFEKPTEAYSNPADPTFVELIFANPFNQGSIYTIVLSDDLTNCIGFPVEDGTSASFGMPDDIEENDIVINEILFNPIDNGVDYVELYNRSDKTFDLSQLLLGAIKQTFPSPADTSLKDISFESRLFLPQTYVLLTTNAQVVGDQYFCSTDNFLDMSSFPTYPSEEGHAILISKSGVIIDEMTYSEDMHYPLLNYTKGVSLERISFDSPSNEAVNWHSASEIVNFGTPGYENSMKAIPEYDKNSITVFPELFTPDGDGYEDATMIGYQFDEAGYTLNIYIFDAQGQQRRHLVKSSLVNQQGSIPWDGLDENGNRVPVGIYVVYTEVFNLDGSVKKYKNAVVVGTR